MTKKKILLITVSVVILIIITGLIFLFTKKADKKLVNPGVSEIKKPPVETPLLLWKDPLGFEFSYPKNLKIDPHEEDMDNYAHVELSSDEKEGRIVVWSKDLLYQDLDDYLVNDEEASGASVMETKLAKVPAKKLLLKGENGNKIITAAIYDELLFLIEADLDREKYWEKIYDKVLTTFTFGTVAGKSLETVDDPVGYEDAGDEIQGDFEGEEIIE